VEAGVGSHTSLWATANNKYAGQPRNLYSTREQLGGYVVLSWHRHFSLGASFEVAMPTGELNLLGGELQAPKLPNGGGGLHLAGHFKLSERLRLDWVNDIWLYGLVTQLGYQSSFYENDNLICPPVASQLDVLERQLYVTLVLRTQLTLGIDLGRVQLVLAAGARNVPHHIKGQTALRTDNSPPLDWRDAFSIYPYVFAGVQVRLAKGFSLVAGLAQPLYFDPVIYAPLVSVGLQFQPGASAEVVAVDEVTTGQSSGQPPSHPAGKVSEKHPQNLDVWPIGSGLGTRQLWLDYARGRRIRHVGIGLLSTGVTGLALTLSIGLTGVLWSPRGGAQNMSAGLMMGFGLVSVILTYAGGSLLVKGSRIQNRAALEILRFRTRSGALQAEVQIGLGSLQVGGRF